MPDSFTHILITVARELGSHLEVQPRFELFDNFALVSC